MSENTVMLETITTHRGGARKGSLISSLLFTPIHINPPDHFWYKTTNNYYHDYYTKDIVIYSDHGIKMVLSCNWY